MRYPNPYEHPRWVGRVLDLTVLTVLGIVLCFAAYGAWSLFQ